eukprot:scaffold5373_cov39-Attheya_sp.AAC.2
MSLVVSSILVLDIVGFRVGVKALDRGQDPTSVFVRAWPPLAHRDGRRFWTDKQRFRTAADGAMPSYFIIRRPTRILHRLRRTTKGRISHGIYPPDRPADNK